MHAATCPSTPVAAAAHRAPFDARLLRRALGLFPTGVTVVTTRDAAGRPVGATVSSFNSVSLEPPLVLFSMAKSSVCCADFEAGGPLVIHVLGAGQMGLSNRFARGGGDKWTDLEYTNSERGAPLLPGALASFECEMFAQYPGGDHTIFVAEVRQLRFGDGAPLIFHGGAYRQLAAELAP